VFPGRVTVSPALEIPSVRSEGVRRISAAREQPDAYAAHPV